MTEKDQEEEEAETETMAEEEEDLTIETPEEAMIGEVGQAAVIPVSTVESRVIGKLYFFISLT